MKWLFERIASLGMLASSLCFADVLELKDGTSLSGKYAGGAPGKINFETGGSLQVISVGQANALRFAEATPIAAAPAITTAPANSVTLPAGTTLLVRLLDPVSSQSPTGTKFTTRLEYDLMAGNIPAIKAGTTIYGQVASSTQARRAVGKSTLDLRLTQVSAGGTPVSIVTGGYQQAGEESIRKAGRGAAAGAAVGAIAGDAGKGAAIGATVGALKRGETVTITPGTLLEFSLTQPVSLNAR